MNYHHQKKHIVIVASVILSFLAGIGVNEVFQNTHTWLKSSYLGDSSISCTRTCPDGSTIDAEQSCSDSSISENYCGDGSVQAPNASGQYEQCDDGNSEDSDTCTNQCVWFTNYAFDTTNSWDNTDNNADANNDTCSNRMAQCGPDSFNPCETGVSSINDSDATSWTCTLKDRQWNLCSSSSVSCGQSEPDDSVCECRETGSESLTDSEWNALVDEYWNAVTRAVISCQSPINPATGNTKYANLDCSVRESTENRAALENARHHVDSSFGDSL